MKLCFRAQMVYFHQCCCPRNIWVINKVISKKSNFIIIIILCIFFSLSVLVSVPLRHSDFLSMLPKLQNPIYLKGIGISSLGFFGAVEFEILKWAADPRDGN